jgi:uncharacterized membrane protein
MAPEQPDARHLLAWPANAAQPARPFESRPRLAAFPFSWRRHGAAVLDQVLADFLAYRTAFLVYWVNIVVLGAFLYATWAYAERAKLIREEAVGNISRAVRRRIVVAQSLYAIGALAGLVNVTLGIILIMLIQLNYAIGPRLPILSRL